MNIKITTLIENNPDNNRVLYNEHGLSLYIEADGLKILFDTGQSGNFISNAEKLNVNLDNLNYVVLSHGHYDHSGGFRKLADKAKASYEMIVGKSFFDSKYKLEQDSYKYIGNSFDEEYIYKKNIKIKYIDDDIFNINDNIMIFSNFERTNDFELINKKFKIKQNGRYTLDYFTDEIALGIKLDKGLLIIAGCSHVGIVNILETIIKRTRMPLYGVIGGTHLIEANEYRLQKTIEFLNDNNISILGLSHCTGEKAMEEIKSKFGDKFIYNNTGNIIKFVSYNSES